jgi:hypothetical protein
VQVPCDEGIAIYIGPGSCAFRSIDLGEQETIALGVTDDAKSLDRRRGINDAIENDAIERQMVRENSARINAFLADGLIRLKLNSQTNLRSRRLWVSSTFASAS